MEQLQLQDPSLVEQLHKIAEHEHQSPEELLNRAVIEFLDKIALKKMQAEVAAYEQMHPELVTQYLGEYVAIHNGALVDHDHNVRDLHIRVRRRFGKMPILLRKVAEEPTPPDIIVRSPKLARVSS